MQFEWKGWNSNKMYETRVKSNGTKLKLKVWNSNKGKILEEKVHNLKKVCKTTKGNNSNIVSYFLVSRNKSKHVFRIFRFFQFYEKDRNIFFRIFIFYRLVKQLENIFSYVYILLVLRSDRNSGKPCPVSASFVLREKNTKL